MNRIIIRSFFLLFVFISSERSFPVYAESSGNQMNIIVISVTPLRADTLGCYGNERNVTPNIDSLARESLVFENAYAHESLTVPSLATLLTSLCANNHNVLQFEESFDLSPRISTLQEILKENGYMTFLMDQDRHVRSGAERGFDHIDTGSVNSSKMEKFLDIASEEKFFLLINTLDLHDPYTPADDTVLMFADKIKKKNLNSKKYLRTKALTRVAADPAMVFTRNAIQDYGRILNAPVNDSKRRKAWDLYNELNSDPEKRRIYIHRSLFSIRRELFWANFDPDDNEDVEYARLLYDAKMYEIDRAIGSMLNMLRERGLMDNTIVIFTSPHGEQFGGHGIFLHSGLYLETLHVPLLLRIPGKTSKSIRVSAKAGLIDIMPTLLYLNNIEIPGYVQGVNLLQLIKDSDQYSERKIFAEEHIGISPIGGSSDAAFSLIKGEFHYISRFSGIGRLLKLRGDSQELYNIVSDPRETTNLIKINENIMTEMRIDLIESVNDMGERTADTQRPLYRLEE